MHALGGWVRGARHALHVPLNLERLPLGCDPYPLSPMLQSCPILCSLLIPWTQVKDEGVQGRAVRLLDQACLVASNQLLRCASPTP